jgi:alkylation response protein AidB-like acyl-CoA dehydrogenase
MAAQVATMPPEKNLQIAWDRVQAIKPLVLKHRREGDMLRRLPDPIAQAFLDGDMYRFQVPEDLGGLEIDPMSFFDLCVELASWDGSVGWNFGIGGGSISMIGTLHPDRLKQIFSTPDCGIAGSIFPPGKAVPVAGGYRISGRWAWASGVHNARWINGVAVVYDGDQMRMEDGQPVTVKAQFARQDVTIHDAWYTGGMKGTGSTEYSVEDQFVPHEHLFTPFGETTHPAPIFRMPGTYYGLPLCAVATGIARGTVEAFKELLLEDKSGLRDQGYAQYALAKAEALHESAQLNVKEAYRPIWEDAVVGRPTNMERRARARRAYVLATETAIEAVTLCHTAAGGAAVFDRNPFHRNLSDVHAASAHMLVTRRMMEQSGQAVLGMPVANPMF